MNKHGEATHTSMLLFPQVKGECNVYKMPLWSTLMKISPRPCHGQRAERLPPINEVIENVSKCVPKTETFKIKNLKNANQCSVI